MNIWFSPYLGLSKAEWKRMQHACLSAFKPNNLLLYQAWQHTSFFPLKTNWCHNFVAEHWYKSGTDSSDYLSLSLWHLSMNVPTLIVTLWLERPWVIEQQSRTMFLDTQGSLRKRSSELYCFGLSVWCLVLFYDVLMRGTQHGQAALLEKAVHTVYLSVI